MFLEVNFPDLEDSRDDAGKVVKKINNYIEEIRDEVTSKLNDLPGSDSYGYVSSAKSLASAKISQLTEKAERFAAFKSRVDTFIDDARTADQGVADKIETVADDVIEKKGFFANVGNAIYDLFCVDLANSNGLTRWVSEKIRVIGTEIGNWAERTVDWFKHGEGKYWLEIGLNVVSTVLSVISAVKTVSIAIGSVLIPLVATIATGGLTLPLLIGGVIAATAAISTTIATINRTVDSIFSLQSDIEAIGHYRNGNPAAARYYGNSEGFSGFVKKTDFGSSELNTQMKENAETFDNVTEGADFVSGVTSIAMLGIKRDNRYKTSPGGYKATGVDFSRENIEKNLKYEMGWRFKKGEVMLDDGTTVERYKFKLSKGFEFDGYKSVKKIKSSVEKINDSVDAIGDFIEDPNLINAGEAVDKTLDALGTTGKFFGTIDKYVDKTVDLITKPVIWALGS